MNSGPGLKPYLNVRETAKLLGVHENTIRNWVKSGVLVSSRLPGASGHRFAREEVQRVQRERGAATSPVAPQLRTSGPELVTASDLDRWASRLDSKGGFPDLMRRLLAMTPGITNLAIRAHEGVAASGWDGSATSDVSAFLPRGDLRFEFGTDRDPKTKAQSDYDKRVQDLPADASSSSFVFATPRNWAGGTAWAAERAKDGVFAGVKAIDAHILEGWLQHTPSVHYWISERLGYNPYGAQTLEQWWSRFRDSTDPKLSAEFFLAGRSAQAEHLRSVLMSAGSTGGPITVVAPSREDARAFIFAALNDHDSLLHRTVIVTDETTWLRLAESASPLIVVSDFERTPGLDHVAAQHEHRVVLLARPDDVVLNGTIVELPKVDRTVAANALRTASAMQEGARTPDSNEIERLVAMARRSVPAFLRQITRGGTMRAPDWAVAPDSVAILAPLVLLGTWTGLPRDVEAIERMTGQDAAKTERLLTSLVGRSDAPFSRTAGEWRLVSPEEAAQLLLPKLTSGDLVRWKEVANEVLLEPDPFRGMDTLTRLATSSHVPQTFSEALRKGICRSLALVAVSGRDLVTFHGNDVVAHIVRDLLDAANADHAGAVWERLSPNLPHLAEAAPDVFIAAVEADLDRPAPIIQTLFRDSQTDAFLGPSSPHPGLLWALETLAWSPDYFGAAAGLLGRLAAIDPGGRLSNRPIESLQKITLGWVRQSGAGVDEKLTVIRRLLETHPRVGWNLLLAVWPAHHATAFPPASPTYRDWEPASQQVSIQEWGQFIQGLVELALNASGTSAAHWQQLVPLLAMLPFNERDGLISSLKAVAANQAWSDDERFGVWDALVKEADKHEKFAGAGWAMSANDVAALREIASGLESTTDARRFAHLFDWMPHIPDKTAEDPGYAEAVERRQISALQDILASGADALDLLATDVQAPHVLGYLLEGLENAPEDHVLCWLDSEHDKLRVAGSAFASTRIAKAGFDWLRTTLADSLIHGSERADALMGCVPFEKKFWDEVSSLSPSLQTAYWARVNIFRVADNERLEAARLLTEQGRDWDAVATLANALNLSQELDIVAVRHTLDHLLQSTESVIDPIMSSYYVGQLLEYLERVTPNDPNLALYEFTFFELLHDHRPSGALYRALGSDPQEFVNLVCAIYRAEGEPKRSGSAKETAFAHLAFSVLRNWKDLPGHTEDGSVDPRLLTEWVRSARLALSDRGRAAVGDEQIGEVLAASPSGTDGVWPAEAVRDLVETIGSVRLDTGLHVGRVNRRGFTSRGIFDGGDQERELESQYLAMADKIATKWPRTARILRSIAEDYRREAKRNDAEAERMADDG